MFSVVDGVPLRLKLPQYVAAKTEDVVVSSVVCLASISQIRSFMALLDSAEIFLRVDFQCAVLV